MLIELIFDKKYSGRLKKFITDFDTSKGLEIKFRYEPTNEIIELPLALREDVGIYWCHSELEYTIKDFTKYEVIDSYSDDILSQIFETQDLKDKTTLRNLYADLTDIPKYGLADNLQQILLFCQRAICHPELKFVLSLTKMPIDINHHKWGEYIGADLKYFNKELISWHLLQIEEK